MLRFAGSRIAVAALALLAIPASQLAAEDGTAPHHPQTASPSILIGFVGGFVRHDNLHHGPVILAHAMQRNSQLDPYVQVFENRHRKAAYKTILRLLDSDHDGSLSDQEKAKARIVLFGQSWGASAAVQLARQLARVGIPVLLTVQVDSVAKPWQEDGIIPDNVEAAVNFYQPHGIIHGRSVIRAADESKTQILGNYLLDYTRTTVKCEGMPWFERAFIPGHMHTECDTHLWGQVETLVRQRLQEQPSDVAVNPSSEGVLGK